MNKKSNVIFYLVIAILSCSILFSLLWSPFLFGGSNYRNLPEITHQGDGTYTMKKEDAVMLNNEIAVSFIGVNNKESTGHTRWTGMDTSVREYPGGTEVGIWLIVNNSHHYFLSPTNAEQQIIVRGDNNFYKPGAVMKLISLDKDSEEAVVSLQSIKGNINLNNPFLVIPIAIVLQVTLAFIAEFIIKRRSTNILYRYTLYRSIIYTLPILILTAFSDPFWGILVAIIIFPFVLIVSSIGSFIAYKVVIKRKDSI